MPLQRDAKICYTISNYDKGSYRGISDIDSARTSKKKLALPPLEPCAEYNQPDTGCQINPGKYSLVEWCYI